MDMSGDEPGSRVPDKLPFPCLKSLLAHVTPLHNWLSHAERASKGKDCPIFRGPLQSILKSVTIMAGVSLFTMTTHHSRKCSDSQERDSGAQHQGCADPDQAHRDKWPWPELWRKTVLQILQLLLAAATLFVHAVDSVVVQQPSATPGHSGLQCRAEEHRYTSTLLWVSSPFGPANHAPIIDVLARCNRP